MAKFGNQVCDDVLGERKRTVSNVADHWLGRRD